MQNLSPGRLALLLATLVALGPLAIDTYLPALLAMSGHFSVEIHAVEVSVSVYVLGVAAGQWLGGPLSDQFGRKPVAYVGLTLFILGCLSIPLSSTIDMLYMLRFLQALGGGATVVIAAASVRDHFTGKEAARVMTTIGLVMLVAPLVAPAVGALLLKLFGWQSIFYMLAMYGFMLFGIVRFLLPTVAVKPSSEPLRQRMFPLHPELQLRHALAERIVLGLDPPQPDVLVPQPGDAADPPGDTSLDLGKQPKRDPFEDAHAGPRVDLNRDHHHMANDDGQQQRTGATAEINQSRSS